MLISVKPEVLHEELSWLSEAGPLCPPHFILNPTATGSCTHVLIYPDNMG